MVILIDEYYSNRLVFIVNQMVEQVKQVNCIGVEIDYLNFEEELVLNDFIFIKDLKILQKN